MDAHTLMEAWEVSPFDGGLEGVRDLQTRGFSGAVEAGGSALFLRDGDPLAVVTDLAGDPRPGDLDALDGAGGDRHTAPRAEAATLAAMLALDGDVRGQYFTEDTPLSTVHETLSEGSFTGYVELSENVLSGDYYVVYRNGREEYVAFVGSSNRVLVDEEARTRAEGEVGIYSVVGVSLPDVDVPQPAEAAGSAGETAAVDSDVAPDTQTSDAVADGRSADEADADGDAAEERVSNVENGGNASTDVVPTGPPAGGGTQTSAGEAGGTDTQGDPPGAQGDSEDAAPVSPATSAETVDPGAGSPGDRGQSAGSEGSVIDAVSSRTVPSLDPQNSRRVQVDAASDVTSTPVVSRSDPGPASVPAPRTVDAEGSSTPGAADEEGETAVREEATGATELPGEGAPGADVEERVEAVREEYEGRLRDLRSEVEELRNERDELRGRIESLQSGAGSTAGAGGSGAGTRSLSPSEAIDGTSLFVREGTRGGATLEDALDGGTDRETLTENVRVEYHTEFDDDGATVESQPFEEWLHGTTHYRLVQWAIVDLLFEIRSTGSASSMRPLYEALPAVDRIGLRDAVAVGEGDEGREITFDVVARDQMGDPLFVATIDERREPTTGEAIQPLVTDASDVCEYNESLTGAFAVTSSYFEPAALDTVREATSGSLLGRDRHRSYVKLARKNGFHLCMVERRNGDFHLTVPEL